MVKLTERLRWKFGFSNGSGNPALQGVYSMGSYSKDYPKVLDLSWPISSGSLSSIEIGNSCVVIGIKDSSDPFLKFLDKLQIQLGSILKVISKEPFDNSMLVETATASISISNQISKNLFVKKL